MTRPLQAPGDKRQIARAQIRARNLERRVDANAGFVIMIFAADAPLEAGSPAGGAFLAIPESLNGLKLSAAAGVLYSPDSSDDITFAIRNQDNSGVDMLSTDVTIDQGDLKSYDSGALPVIDDANALVATGDRIIVDLTGAGTDALGLDVILEFA